MKTPDSSPRDPAARLHSLLRVRRQPEATMFASATAEAVAEARALGPELAASAVARILDAFEPGRDSALAQRAADLAHQLRLSAAVPALVGCLERLSEFDAVAHAALRALERMPAEATGPLLAAFARCPGPESRLCIASALLRASVRDARVRAAFVTVLEDEPGFAAGCLAECRDRSVLPQLSATLDRLAPPPPGTPFDDELRGCEQIVEVAQAIGTLRGALSAPQRAKFEQAWARSEELLLSAPPKLGEPAAAWVDPGAQTR